MLISSISSPGVGVKGGIAVLIHGLRALMELHPEFANVSLDVINAHNCFDRDACLRAYGRVLSLARFVPFIYALPSPESRVVAGQS